MSFTSVKEMVSIAQEKNMGLWQVILEDDMQERQVTRLESIGKMSEMYLAMKEANLGYDKNLKSASGLSGGDGEKMMEEVRRKQNLTGEFVGTVMANALKMGESNACMKRIVAAPTAGACGVLPAVLLTYEEFHRIPEEKMLEGMYVAAGVGQVIASRASIAGAQGGCQAEIGSASCMAAAAITYIRGGKVQQIMDAGAFALKSLLGLVCDPLGGLVEVPCIKRNVIGSVNAITASDMAMAGIESKVPLDEVIDAMAEVGDLMPCALKETSQAGLAQTETGKRYFLQ
ncbi:MAG: L-serine ammonia-lyase, iron-sulfur-dependent, subunit alpha [Anaerostipes faecalis]|uniref:L-serine ammonia-lyase, iron-sulfur-dependent, subunit alpha n=1 Tax=Anaerostipes faecalis TaxID=2738446 RepID=UPI001C1DFC68|nr:L-serine ammonia-lyase, iron-sulfur-dependent, subunit alpha [Anaerostipes faecalis]MDY2726163.1 L-serine ammonia-lyase, iron-sulfur-dependent, subunit alpha [Anaerostipes faecalis]